MTRRDYRINKYGIDVIKQLKVGQWIELEFNDGPKQRVLLLSIEKARSTAKYERSITVFAKDENGDWYFPKWCVGTEQITRILGEIK